MHACPKILRRLPFKYHLASEMRNVGLSLLGESAQSEQNLESLDLEAQKVGCMPRFLNGAGVHGRIVPYASTDPDIIVRL